MQHPGGIRGSSLDVPYQPVVKVTVRAIALEDYRS
jgi:hypothetical protein